MIGLRLFAYFALRLLHCKNVPCSVLANLISEQCHYVIFEIDTTLVANLRREFFVGRRGAYLAPTTQIQPICHSISQNAVFMKMRYKRIISKGDRWYRFSATKFQGDTTLHGTWNLNTILEDMTNLVTTGLIPSGCIITQRTRVGLHPFPKKLKQDAQML